MDSNKIEIIISGNLTGFTHFYATQGVKDWYADAKFDFDYRNYVTFLKRGEKAYALSFVSSYVVASLIIRILDSFQRPGILVVSVLLPRGQKVASVAPSGSDKALYDLLNALNGRFCERNLMGDMLNPSLSVLRQDYYSDILSGYQLVPEPGQHRLNGDVASLLKGGGYVAAEERAMPVYLASPFRRSYEGYPHVFFAPNAPENIAEPAEEEVMYQVRVTNTHRMLPGWVHSKDKIYQLAPESWQLPIGNLDYTYEEVLRGEAERVRAAVGTDGILDITYNFAPKTKEITFVFKKKGGNALPFDEVAPVRIIEKKSGANYPLPSATYEFRGQEIEGEKALESDGYFIEPTSLDLSRCDSRCIVTVERKSLLQFNFPKPYDTVPKRILLTRTGTGQSFQEENVSGAYYSLPVPGEREEWEYKIEAEGYHTLCGIYPPEGEKIRLNLVEKRKSEIVSQFSSRQRQGTVSTTNTRMQENVRTSSTGGVRGGGSAEGNAVPIHYINSGGESGKRRKGNSRIGKLLPFLIALPVLALAVGLGIFWLPKITEGDGMTKDETVSEPKKVDKNVKVRYIDLANDTLLPDIFNEKANITLQCCYNPVPSIKTEGMGTDGSQVNLAASEDCGDEVGFFAMFDGILLGDTLNIAFDSFEKDTIIYYKLDVYESDLAFYRKMKAEEEIKADDELDNEYKRRNKVWNDNENMNSELVKAIDSLYKTLKPNESENVVDVNKNLLEELSKVEITLKNIVEIENQLKKAKKWDSAKCPNESILVKDRIEALRGAINTLKNGYSLKRDDKKGFRPSTDNLSKDQKECIEKLFKSKDIEKKINQFGNSGYFETLKSENNIKSIIDHIRRIIGVQL